MDFKEKFRAAKGDRIRLDAIDPGFKGHHETAEAAKTDTALYLDRLTGLQSLLYAESARSVLIVLQGMDGGGKDGTIGHVFGALNPRGARVVSFKRPTAAELARDFLWRIHSQVPARGEIVIFNRSHYEDVLVPKVHKTITDEAWEQRLEQIRAFESALAANGTSVLKFFLHISKDEQLARFAARLDDPARNWKISEADYSERAFWDTYRDTYGEVLARTTTAASPWFVIPANHKWFRNLAVSAIVVETMEEFRMRYPKPAVDLARIRREYHAAEQAALHGRR